MDLLTCISWSLLAWTLVQAFQFIANKTKPSKLPLPPRPFAFPIIGHLFHFKNKSHKSLAKLAKTHGPIMTLKLGNITTIVISSATIAKQVLQKQDLSFANRFIPDSIRDHHHDQLSIAWLPVSPKWRTLRKICNNFIFASRKLEANHHLRRYKVQELVADVQESCKAGAPVDIGRAAFKTTLNMVSNSIFSVDLDDGTKGKIDFKELVRIILEEGSKPNLVDIFHVPRKIDPQGIRRRMTAYLRIFFKFFESMIHERMKLRKEHDFVPSKDVLDTLLGIIEDEGNEEFDITDINILIMDLFIAGMDTTSSTLEWAMAEVLHNPKVLTKVKEELTEIIGKGNPIEESHITRLPYLQAIVKETLRLHPPIPFLLPRRLDTEVELCGYTIPKGVQVLVNTWAIGQDSSTWVNPESFVPERFLGSDIDVKGHNFELIPFGAGRRVCPGLPLATRIIYLMLGSLVHSFDWKLENGVAPEDMDMEEKLGLTPQKARPLSAIPIPV